MSWRRARQGGCVSFAVTAPEDRISDALRHGRIGRFRAWWARLWCGFHGHDRGPEFRIQKDNGIDKWTVARHKCLRCGKVVGPAYVTYC